MRRAYGDTSQAALIERGNLGSKQFECGHQEDGLTNLQAALHGLGGHYGADNGAAQSFTFTIIWFLTRADRHDDAMDWVGRLNAHSLRDATSGGRAKLRALARTVPCADALDVERDE